MVWRNYAWSAVSDLSLISDLSQKIRQNLWRVKMEHKLSRKQHITPAAAILITVIPMLDKNLWPVAPFTNMV